MRMRLAVIVFLFHFNNPNTRKSASSGVHLPSPPLAVNAIKVRLRRCTLAVGEQTWMSMIMNWLIQRRASHTRPAGEWVRRDRGPRTQIVRDMRMSGTGMPKQDDLGRQRELKIGENKGKS